LNINVQNNDNNWFFQLYIQQIKFHRVLKYKTFENEFEEVLNGIEIPVKLSDVPKFAKRTAFL